MNKPNEETPPSELVAELQRLRAALDDAAAQHHHVEVYREELNAQEEELTSTRTLLEASRDAYAELYDFAPIAYLTLDRYGLVTAINLTGCSLLEGERARLLGLPLTLFVVPEDRERVLDHMRRCRSSDEREIKTEVRLKSRGGRVTPVLLTSRKHPSERSFRTVLFDLTEQKQSQEEIHRLNADLERRVARRTEELEEVNQRLQQELVQRQSAEQALRAADRRKDEFLAMLGHELRNPLAPLRHSAELLQGIAAGDADVVQIAQIIARQTHHMARIIDDLLDVSRILSGKINLRTQAIELRRLVGEVVEDARKEFDAKGVALQYTPGDEPCWVAADSVRLTQVVSNLLHNARKFTDAGGSVSVTLTAQADHAQLVITDTGVGIEPDMLPQVFDSFTQADSSLDRSSGGLGLGLALVRGIIALHGGTVSAASAGRGQGAQFTVSLPLVPAPEKDLEGPPPAAVPQGPLRVLVIEDQAETAWALGRLIRHWGHEVLTATSGAEGLQLAGRSCPHIILSDIGLPDIDGYSLARRLRSIPDCQGVRLVAITGYGQADDRHRAYDAGFDLHLTKPVEPDAIKEILEGSYQPAT